jgi:hypothetical protein
VGQRRVRKLGIEPEPQWIDVVQIKNNLPLAFGITAGNVSPVDEKKKD